MTEFEGSTTSLVADVDCTAEGKELCDKNDVKGYPTIKYGEPGELKDYDGGRSFEDLKKFADENLGPTCGPEHMDLCIPEVKQKIQKFMEMSEDRLTGKIRNAIRVVEEEVPLMKKVVAFNKKGSKSSEL